MTLDTVRQHIGSGHLEKASEALRGLEKSNGDQADVLYLRGYVQELSHDREAALATYEKALEVDPQHPDACFRAALIADQGGDDETAIDLYENCTSTERVPLHALVNLSVLYEEQGLFRRAEACLSSVLAADPNHTRARQFLKSVRSSFLMLVDERGQREREQHDAILDMPVSEFELSVRSRNCLRQMGLRTVGDLLATTEAELLAYKNFGETSLNEIKAVLTQKGLRLGRDVHSAEPPPEPVEVERPRVDTNIHLLRPVTELELSVRSRKCLQRLGVASIGELIQHSDAELMTIKNFGQTSLNEIRQQLALLGLTLRKRL